MNCPKGKRKGTAMNWLNSGKGATGQWNVGAVNQSVPAAGNQADINQADFTPPMWDNANQAIEADFGGSWDAAINEVSMDTRWMVVTRRPRGNGDMRPIRFGRICCPSDNHLHSIERAGNQMNCINEVTSDGQLGKTPSLLIPGQLIQWVRRQRPLMSRSRTLRHRGWDSSTEPPIEHQSTILGKRSFRESLNNARKLE